MPLRSSRLAAVAAALLMSSVAGGQSPPVAADRGMKATTAAPTPPPGYGKTWAVVVGVNYPKASRPADLGEVAPLQHARSDAEAFHALLTASFGYDKDEARLLVDGQATARAMTELLNEGLLRNPKVGEDDSVLFYFSGHGYLDQSAAGPVGYLFPTDVKVESGDRPNVGTAVDLTAVVRNLRDSCKARHKLLILDCCHSGVVFRLDGSPVAGRYDHLDRGPGAFRERVFQALSASRESQKASDGRDGHSPFTAALLRAMRTLGRKEAVRDRRFTADELFVEMGRLVRNGTLPEDQSPQFKRLTPDQGQFHFLLGPDAQFPEKELTPDERNLLLATVPSTFGNWWADEVPWFMPALRQRILPELTPTRSAQPTVDRDELWSAAQRARERAGDKPADDRLRKRFDQMTRVYDAATSRVIWTETLKAVVGELEEATRDRAVADPTDLHYLAVLYQKQEKFADAKRSYEAAQGRYETLAGGGDEWRPMWALCLLDHGLLELNHLRTKRYQSAADLFKKARQAFKDKFPPKPFELFALCKEADAWRRGGRPGLSNVRYDDALNVVAEWDPARTHLLTAATYKNRAWGHMETWRFDQARSDFQTAADVLGRNKDRTETQVDALHVRHGLAMAERFQGQPETALDQYRRLTADVAQQIGKLDDDRTEVPNYAALRYLLYERLVNSLERQADCSLFGFGDPAEAADDYRRALQGCHLLPPNVVNERRKDILYRRAVALCLPSRARDVDLAAHLCDEADGITLQAGADDKTRVAACLANALVARNKGVAVNQPSADPLGAVAGGPPAVPPACPAGDLRALLVSFRTKAADHDRDLLERLMFAHKYLVEDKYLGDTPPTGRDRFHALEDVDELLRLCRSACQGHAPDPGQLKYLRPYFDVAFLAKKKMAPGHVKELIEIAWEATRGTQYHKPHGGNAVLAVYFAGCPKGGCHLLLDAAGGPSQCFSLKNVWTAGDLAAAAGPGDAPQLPLPDDVRAALGGVVRGPVEYRWRDPVYGIGYAEVRTSGYTPAQPAGGATVSHAHDLGLRRPRLADRHRLPFNRYGLAKGVDLVDEDNGKLRFGPTAGEAADTAVRLSAVDGPTRR